MKNRRYKYSRYTIYTAIEKVINSKKNKSRKMPTY